MYIYSVPSISQNVCKYFTANIKVLPLFFSQMHFFFSIKKDVKFMRTKIGGFFNRYIFFLHSLGESILFRFLLTGSLLFDWVIIQILAFRFIDLQIIFVQRDAWNRALPFIALHVSSYEIWRCTKWVPCNQWRVNKARNQHHPH